MQYDPFESLRKPGRPFEYPVRCRMTDSELVSRYLLEVEARPRLTADEEADLLRRLRCDDSLQASAKKDLIEAHLYLVVDIVERFRHTAAGWLESGGDVLELFMQGNMELLRAADSFAAVSGFSFKEHAAPNVERAIRDAMNVVEP
jgi:DNA-directed RNA polymerase sigma subunit (sigma70/sigma32)